MGQPVSTCGSRQAEGRTHQECSQTALSPEAIAMTWTPRPIRAVPVATFLALLIALQPVASQESCYDWNTPDFFRAATPTSVERCLDAGADPNARDEDYGMTPLYAAAAYSETPAVVQVLLNAGADPNARSEGGMTPLHVAAALSEALAVVQVLLNAGADPNARSEGGWIPLHFAAAYSEASAVVQVLLNAGADPNARGETSWTPLHFAAAHSEAPAVVQALLNAGADPSARDVKGNVPFEYVPEDSPLRSTDVYWRLYKGRFE